MAAKNPQVNYLARDFDSIKNELINYAKRFYPNQYKDFTDASFGSFLLDTVAYLGDVVSFQLDYQSNENILGTAINRENIIRLARQYGYSDPLSPNITGFITVYIQVPANASNTGPDVSYLPVLKAGTNFSSTEGAVFSLIEDMDFSESDTEYVVAEVNATTGIPTKYAAKRFGPIASGIIETAQVIVQDRSSSDGFFEATLTDTNIIEVISVFDTEGNEYYQVEALTQDVIYKQFLNEGTTASNTLKVMKPVVAPRRFITKFEDNTTSLIFGNGKEDADSVLDSVNDPTKVVLDKYGKDYISSTVLDPTVLSKNDKFGVGPSNTVLTITYRANGSDVTSAGALTLTNVDSPRFVFPLGATDQTKKDDVAGSIETENEQQIVGSRVTFSNDEIKEIAKGIFSSQNRVVTTKDYENFSYRMPAQFGSIKRAVAMRDDFSPRRSINLYVLSEDNLGNLTVASQTIKDNLKTWLSQHKTVSDSVDILDGRIINFGVKFSFVTNPAFSQLNAVSLAQQAVEQYFNERKYYFGESINIADIVKMLNDTEPVGDVVKIEFISKTGGVYSDIEYDFVKNTTTDGRFIKIPEDYVFEIKFFATNIIGEAL